MTVRVVPTQTCDSTDVPGDQKPALTLEKTATPTTYDTVGDIIGYSYLVTNTGNVTLAGPLTVADDNATVTCPAGGLTPLASMTCTASHTITQGNLDGGSVKNTATAVGTAPTRTLDPDDRHRRPEPGPEPGQDRHTGDLRLRRRRHRLQLPADEQRQRNAARRQRL